MILRPPRLDELPYLSDLCLRSKAVWDYDEAMLDAFKDELTLTVIMIANKCGSCGKFGMN